MTVLARGLALQSLSPIWTLCSSKMLCRVIALAYKKLAADQTAAQIRELSRDEVEKDLEFGGFAILQCPLKPESEPALRMLKESSHQLVMITGDAPLTACHAASKVHIVDRPTIILTGRWEPPRLYSSASNTLCSPDCSCTL